MLYVVLGALVLVAALIGKNLYDQQAEQQRVDRQREARVRQIDDGMRSGQAGTPLRDFAVSQSADSAIGLSEDGKTLVLLSVEWPTNDDDDQPGTPNVQLRTLRSEQLLDASVRTREAAVVDKKGRVKDSGNMTVDLHVYTQDLERPVVRVRFMGSGSGGAEAFERAIRDAVHWEGMVRALASMVDHAVGLDAAKADTKRQRTEDVPFSHDDRRLRARQEAERLAQSRGLSLPRG